MKDNREHVKPMPCPYCGVLLDDATAPLHPEASPGEGDVTLCVYCAGLLIYDKDGVVRFPTDEEALSLQGHPELTRIRRAAIDALAMRARKEEQ